MPLFVPPNLIRGHFRVTNAGFQSVVEAAGRGIHIARLRLTGQSFLKMIVRHLKIVSLGNLFRMTDPRLFDVGRVFVADVRRPTGSEILECPFPFGKTRPEYNSPEMGPHIRGGVPPAVDHIGTAARFGQIPGRLQLLAEFGEHRDQTRLFPRMMFRFRRPDQNRPVLPVHVGPAQFKRFRRVPQAADPAQRQKRPPGLVGARVQKPFIMTHRDKVHPVLVDERFAFHVLEGVLINVIVANPPPENRARPAVAAGQSRVGVSVGFQELLPPLTVGGSDKTGIAVRLKERKKALLRGEVGLTRRHLPVRIGV